MYINTNHNCIAPASAIHVTNLRLDQVVSPTLTTEQAAFYLNRKPQTLRAWACLENGPLRPLRINGRLAWVVEDIRTLLKSGRNE